MNRNQSLAAMDAAIAKATGPALEALKAHRAAMVEGFAKQDAALVQKIAAHKRRTREWQKSIDFRPY